MKSYFHNSIRILLLTCSKIRSDDDPHRVDTRYKALFDGYLFTPHFKVLHGGMPHNFKEGS